MIKQASVDVKLIAIKCNKDYIVWFYVNNDSRNAMLKLFLYFAISCKLVDNVLVKSYNTSMLKASLA